MLNLSQQKVLLEMLKARREKKDFSFKTQRVIKTHSQFSKIMKGLIINSRVNHPIKKGKETVFELTDKGEREANSIASDIDNDPKYKNLYKKMWWDYVYYDY